MKTLLTLTLMLITLNLFGQGYKYEIKGDTIYIHESRKYEIIADFIKLTCDTIMPPSRDELIRSYIYSNSSLIALMDYYAEDCYNDSALVSIPYSCNMPGCIVNHFDTKEWVHAKPTFEGFMEWMNNKLDTY